MALSTAEATSIEARFQAIENKLNELQIAVNNLATKAQMKSLLNIRQAEIEDLKTRTTVLENKVAILES